MVALMEVPPEQIHRYGRAAVEGTGEEGVVRVAGLVEQPSRRAAPSTYALIGLCPRPRGLRRPGAHAAGGTVHGVVLDGQRYDTGDKADCPRPVVRLACDRPDLGPEFVGWLREFAAWLKKFAARIDGARRLAT